MSKQDYREFEAYRALGKPEKLCKKQGWISVKDRLPEPEQPCLLHALGWTWDDGCPNYYVGYLHHEDAETSWLTGITSQESKWHIRGWSYLKKPIVTHWMPMPEAPKEEQ